MSANLTERTSVTPAHGYPIPRHNCVLAKDEGGPCHEPAITQWIPNRQRHEIRLWVCATHWEQIEEDFYRGPDILVRLYIPGKTDGPCEWRVGK